METTYAMSYLKTLPKQEQIELLKQVQNGALEARNKIIEHNMRLVLHIAKKYYATGIETEELISIGTIGLIKGVDTYQLEKGANFATYTSRCIENEILMYLRKYGKESNKISLESTISKDHEGNELVIKDILIGEEDVDLSNIEASETKEEVRLLLNTLPPREKKIILMHFGFFSEKQYTQKEISEILGISQSYISRIVKKSLKQLRDKIEMRGNETMPKEKTNNFYLYFEHVEKDILNNLVNRLSLEEQQLLQKKYGKNLLDTTPLNVLTSTEITQFRIILNKLRRWIEKEKKIPSQSETKKEIENTNPLLKSIIPLFLKQLPWKESVILGLRFGCMNETCYEIETISQFLKIPSSEIRNIIIRELEQIKSVIVHCSNPEKITSEIEKILKIERKLP